jgi:serine/threonine-protein kinase HipA
VAAPELELWLGEQLVARTVTRTRSGAVRIVYTEQAAEQHADGTLLLSCSLPTPGPSAPGVARAFLEGLLPEGRALEAAAAAVRGVRLMDGAPATTTDAVQLLAAYGRECAGAVVAVPAGDPPPGLGRYQSVDANRMVEIIRDLPRRPLGADPERGIRMSLAGAQPKFLLARFNGAWFEPLDGAASTHILKPAADWGYSAQNEAMVLFLARTAKLTECDAWVEHAADGTAVLVTARYDRRMSGRRVIRSHQEDMCQALGIRPKDKYRIGRPSELARQLRRFADEPAAQTRAMFRQVAFRVLIGDEDGHGKNYSLLLRDGGVQLAPIYDTLCTLIYPELTGRVVGGIGMQQQLPKMTRVALLDEARAMGLPEPEAATLLDELAAQLRAGLEALPDPLVTDWPSELVTDTVSNRLDRLESGKALGEAVGFASPRARRRATGPTMSEPRVRSSGRP